MPEEGAEKYQAAQKGAAPAPETQEIKTEVPGIKPETRPEIRPEPWGSRLYRLEQPSEAKPIGY